MTIVDKTDPSKLLDYLPAIYRDDPFLSKYLSAFEKILLGRNDTEKIPGEKEGAETRSLEETIDRIPALFDPEATPKDFLPWLASWAALTLRADLDEGEQIRFVAKIIQRYRRRGTKQNLIELLEIFTQIVPEIDEDAVPSEEFRKRFDQFKEGDRPLHFFKVTVWLTDPSHEKIQRTTEIAQAIIDLEKPAHTFYEFQTRFQSLQIVDYPEKEEDKRKYRATLGVDTVLNIWANVRLEEPKED